MPQCNPRIAARERMMQTILVPGARCPVHGDGPPLVLLHGNLSTIEVDFGGVIPSLAKTRRVIAVEQQAHGHTADIDRALSIDSWTSDTAALLRLLDVTGADVFGYSSGSAVALQLALDHPDLVRKLVLASFAYNADGLIPRSSAGSRTYSRNTWPARLSRRRTHASHPDPKTGRN